MKKLLRTLGLAGLLLLGSNQYAQHSSQVRPNYPPNPNQPRYSAPQLYQAKGDSLIKLMYEAKLTPEIKDSINQYDEAIRYFCDLSKYFFQKNKAAWVNFDHPEISVPYIKAVISQESQGYSIATSVKDAMGLMQIIPSTGYLIRTKYGLIKWMHKNKHRSYFNRKFIDIKKVESGDLYNPNVNLLHGIYYSTALGIKYNWDPIKMADAWNSQPKWVDLANNWDPNFAETIFFSGKVFTYLKQWEEIEILLGNGKK